MREIFQDVAQWLSGGETGIAIATVLKTFGSAPRKEGAKLAFLPDDNSETDAEAAVAGRLSGSISGGCVESAIIEEASAVIRSRTPRIIHFDTSDDDAWDVGLPCGGSIDVLVEPIDIDTFNFIRSLIERNERAVTLTLIGEESGLKGKLSVAASGKSSGSFPPELRDAALKLASSARQNGRYMLSKETEVFVDIFAPVPTLVAVGGVHTAMALVRMARILGFRTVVVDPRKTFSTAERFPDVDLLLSDWPQEAFERFPITEDTAIVVLTHDPKLDDPALEAALSSDAFYIGALGSVKTQEKRRKRLGGFGFEDKALARIHGPVGLEIGSSTPEQIALSIIAEVVAVMNGQDGSVPQKRHAESVIQSGHAAR
ncbi:MAG TPA: XdhC/CoxI family protein [Spirochaetia bacterium]|nr:XdhC/CoxI family protein [Spirochaetia bacterium]